MIVTELKATTKYGRNRIDDAIAYASHVVKTETDLVTGVTTEIKLNTIMFSSFATNVRSMFELSEGEHGPSTFVMVATWSDRYVVKYTIHTTAIPT